MLAVSSGRVLPGRSPCRASISSPGTDRTSRGPWKVVHRNASRYAASVDTVRPASGVDSEPASMPSTAIESDPGPFALIEMRHATSGRWFHISTVFVKVGGVSPPTLSSGRLKRAAYKRTDR